MDKHLDEIPEKYYGFIYHYYRAEVYRETNWRNRLDATTNWAIIVTAAIISYAFSKEDVSHAVILLSYLMTLFFLYIESRRFRYYTMLKHRTRIIEQHMLAPIYKKKEVKKEVLWKESLAKSLESPAIHMSRIESIAWRLRRNYVFLLVFIFITWIVRIFQYPINAQTLQQAITNARLWFLSGEIVASFLVASIVGLLFLALYVPERSSEDDLP